MYSTSTVTVKEILHNKGHGYLGMPPGASAYAALEVMADQDVGSLLVWMKGNWVGVSLNAITLGRSS